jgi:predicted PurR-regulated permease PerM
MSDSHEPIFAPIFDPRQIQRVLALLFICLLAYLNYRMLTLFFSPLAWAAILAIFFYPVHKWVLRKIKRGTLGAIVTTMLVGILLVVPVVLVGIEAIQQGVTVFKEVPMGDVGIKVQNAVNKVAAKLPISTPELKSKVTALAEKAGAVLAGWSTSAIGEIGKLVFDGIIMVIALFYFFRNGKGVLRYLADFSPRAHRQTEIIFGEIKVLVNSTITSNLVVALVQGSLAGLAFWVLSLPAPLFWGVLSGVIAFLPLIAPSLVWGGAAIYLFIMGAWVKGIIMFLMGFFIISGVDNILRPALIAGSTQLNGLVTIIALIGGISVFGFLGLVLGPLLAAVTVGILNGYRTALVEQREGTETPT